MNRFDHLPPNVKEMLALADVHVIFHGLQSFSITKGGAIVDLPRAPNYDDFVRAVQQLMNWKCSEEEETHGWARMRAKMGQP